MLIQLLEPFQGLKAGATWNMPWANVAQKLIQQGKAIALEDCDKHLNPQTEQAAEPTTEPTAEPEPEPEPEPEAKPKKNKRK